MRRIPNFVLLRAFEAAARLESFSLAAAELSLTPSAISHQIKELEGFFGKALFKRLHRRVELTPEGRRLAEGLTRVLDALEATCADVGLVPAGQVLSLYCAPSLAVKWLGPRLPAFAKAHPDITVRLTSGAEPMDLTRARELDIAISYGSAVERPGVDVMPLGAETTVPLCAPSLLADRRAPRDILNDATLIESQLNRVTWRDWYALNGLTPSARPRQSFDRAALSIAAACDGMGIALESTRLAERELARGELVEFGAGTFQRITRETHFLSLRQSEREVPKVQKFATWLLAQLQTTESSRVNTRRRTPVTARR